MSWSGKTSDGGTHKLICSLIGRVICSFVNLEYFSSWGRHLVGHRRVNQCQINHKMALGTLDPIRDVDQLNSLDGDGYQSLLLKPSVGQFGLIK